MLVLVGSSPSSGSTLLSELLDSTPLSMSGEELGLFANKKFFSDYQAVVNTTSQSKSIYVARNGIFNNGLASFGMSKKSINKLLNESTSQSDFVDNFINRYGAFRNKQACILFEKTPQNLNCIGEFLEAFSSSYFVHIVRNPIYVYQSLINRGFPPYIALATWLIDVAAFFPYKDHERVVSLTYEDLVESPYSVVSGLLKKISGQLIEECVLEEIHKTNSYREKYTIKIKSWSQAKAGEVNASNSKKVIAKEIVETFRKAQRLRVSPRYAKKFDLPEVSYPELMEYFGYNEVKFEQGVAVGYKGLKDYRYLASKFYHDYKNGDANLYDLGAYLSPLSID